MKKLVLAICALCMAMGAFAQQSDVELGKKWYDAERYSKALPYLKRAAAAGDVDSKARLATMIFTSQVPEYNDDPDDAIKMFDECIAQGSVFALERKGFCLLMMGDDTKEDKLAALDLIKQASEKGNGDASAELFEVYRNGLKSYQTGADYITPNDSTATVYAKLAAQQGNQEGKAYVGWYTYQGTHGFDKNEAAGIKLIEEAYGMGARFFTTNCLEPARTLAKYYKANGQATKATAITTLLKKYHPTEM